MGSLAHVCMRTVFTNIRMEHDYKHPTASEYQLPNTTQSLSAASSLCCQSQGVHNLATYPIILHSALGLVWACLKLSLNEAS